MKARTDTKEKIIELGTALIKSIGYPSLSYQQISSQLGIKNAAIHYHYPSKEDLGCDIVSNEIARFEKFISSVSGLGPLEKLEVFLGSYRVHLEDGNKICLIGAGASDFLELPKSMQLVYTEYLFLLKNWFIDLLETGRKAGVFHFKGEPVNKASVMISALAGALQHARLIGNDHYDAVAAQLKEDLKA
ncbi:TetR/AcrR family transcriptional regulator [Dyadobacter sp. LHD-138]|uniref:TetR/AcrR family transcriptional regulator n=1 Tax=Dyadobacter sp. LHD-138 TaxID=3071413 RepID=UPI0027E139D2|nr:TetR/AcrR family transcriptional regulator [Dyadobacter sp. LHD-138]MDQ6479168.1 TetR/AcrR family transcriptional regulator [Dyadobacter sp. LHD-138]